MTTITESWESFQQQVIPADAPMTQHSEMQLAFYYGVVSLLHLMYTCKPDTEEAFIAMMNGWGTECCSYLESVRQPLN
jgi:hypothetical protein